MQGLGTFYALYPFWFWMGAAALLLACEVATGSGYLLWPAASAALVAVICAGLHPGLPEAVAVFAALTVASTYLARRFLPPADLSSGADINDKTGRLVGRTGQTVSLFVGGQGRVFVDGAEWAAELPADQPSPEPGARVEVVEVLGARLKVRSA